MDSLVQTISNVTLKKKVPYVFTYMGAWMHGRDIVTLRVIRSKNPPYVQRDWAKFKTICNEVNSDITIAKTIIATFISISITNPTNLFR